MEQGVCKLAEWLIRGNDGFRVRDMQSLGTGEQ